MPNTALALLDTVTEPAIAVEGCSMRVTGFSRPSAQPRTTRELGFGNSIVV